MPTIDLTPRHIAELRTILERVVPGAEVLAYGSRVNGRGHEGSDLDLVVRNPERPDDPEQNLRRLREDLSESNLPILVEALDWARIPEEFRREIQCQPVVVLTRGTRRREDAETVSGFAVYSRPPV